MKSGRYLYNVIPFWRDNYVFRRLITWAIAWMTGVPFPAGAGIFPPCHHIQTGSGVHPDSSPIGIMYSFPLG
jgi:hypothetical protein